MKFAVSWLGRELDKQCLKDLKVLSDKFGIDVCGEKGEYHTMIIDAPIFKKTIDVSNFSKGRKIFC
jgi:diphthine-ammonia ligase